MTMKIFNTLTRKKEEFLPLKSAEVGIYSCGVTVYDHAHIGHARSVMVFDVICRYLAFKGYRVTFVRNFTDVDDKIIRRAQHEGVSASDISERYIAEFRTDMHTLGVLPPAPGIVYHDPKATDFVPEMVALIERLVAGGFAYVVNGDVYFEIRRFPRYGRLSGKNLDELLAGARVDVDERKRDPRDFALWKAAKPGEPAWPSPWGPGRPGWHIECSVMASRYLGETFDIHGGGEDLIFPHHECEIAQSEAATGKPFARFWLHNGMLNLGSEKMSKSLGNTLLIREVVRRHSADAVRFWLLGTHYRNPIEFSEERLRDAGRSLDRFRVVMRRADAAREIVAANRPDPTARPEDWAVAEFEATLRYQAAAFVAAMDDDFNTPAALAAAFDTARLLNAHWDFVSHAERRPVSRSEAIRFVGASDSLFARLRMLGLFSGSQQATEPPPDVGRLATERAEARKQRDWSRADRLRQDILKLGWIVEDTPAGPRLTPKGSSDGDST